MKALLVLVAVSLSLPGCAERPGAAADGKPEPRAPGPAAPPRQLGLCVACHGEDGRSRIAAAPHLAGQNPLYLVWALNQYQAGRREGEVMSRVAGALSQADIEALARWYASRPCAGGAVP